MYQITIIKNSSKYFKERKQLKQKSKFQNEFS